MGNRAGKAGPDKSIFIDWNWWFTQWTAGHVLKIPINMPSLHAGRRFVAPTEKDAAFNLTKLAESIGEFVRTNKVSSVILDLNIPPTTLHAQVPFTRRAPHSTHGNHMLNYLLPGLLKCCEDEKSPLTSVTLPLFEQTPSGPVEREFDRLLSLERPLSLSCVSLTHVALDITLTDNLHYILQHTQRYPTNAISELHITYEMDRISVAVAQSLCMIFDTDTLISFSISKNMAWTPVLPQLERPVGIDDAVIKLWANSWRNCKKLRRLGLSSNALSDVAAKILSSVIDENKSLQLEYVDLSKNQIDGGFLPLMSRMLHGDRAIATKALDFSSNRISELTFSGIMDFVDTSNHLQLLDLRNHELNLDAYRLWHGTVARVNNRRKALEKDSDTPVAQISVECSGVTDEAEFGYSVALPGWMIFGPCFLLQGAFYGSNLSLTNIIQGRITRSLRGGWYVIAATIAIGAFLGSWCYIMPYLIMESQTGSVSQLVRHSVSLTFFLIPLLIWLLFILVVAWRDPSKQWITIDKPVFTMRTEPRNIGMVNILNVILIFVDFCQLTSLHFLQEGKPDQAVDSSGGLAATFNVFILNFGFSTFEGSFWTMVIFVWIWWLITVFIISSIAVRRPGNALKLPTAAVDVIANALFLTIVSTLLKAMDCTYVSDPRDPSLQLGFLDATCDLPLVNGSGLIGCGRAEIQCWVEDRHRRMVFMALLCLVWYLLSAPTVGTFFTEDHTGEVDVQFVEAFTLVEKFVKLCMAISVIFFTNNTWISPTVVMIGLTTLFVTAVWLRPCQHIGWINNLRIGLYALAWWSGLCSIIAKANADPTNKLPLIVFGIGWGAISFLTILGIAYAKMNVASARESYEKNKQKDRAANHSMRKLDDIFVEMNHHDQHSSTSPTASPHAISAYDVDEKRGTRTNSSAPVRTGHGSTAPSPASVTKVSESTILTMDTPTARPASKSNTGASQSLSHQVREHASPSVSVSVSGTVASPSSTGSNPFTETEPPTASIRGRLLSPSSAQSSSPSPRHGGGAGDHSPGGSRSPAAAALLSPPAVRKMTRDTRSDSEPPSPSLNPFDDDYDEKVVATPSSRPTTTSPAASQALHVDTHDASHATVTTASPYASFAVTPSAASTPSSVKSSAPLLGHGHSGASDVPTARPKRKAPPAPLTHVGHDRQVSHGGHGAPPPIPSSRPTRAPPSPSPRTPNRAAAVSVAPSSPSPSSATSPSSARPLLAASPSSSDSLAVPPPVAAHAHAHTVVPTVTDTPSPSPSPPSPRMSELDLPASLARMVVPSSSMDDIKRSPSAATPATTTTTAAPAPTVAATTIASKVSSDDVARYDADGFGISRDDDGDSAISFSNLQ